MFYGARYYDTYLNRWTSPDSIVPQPGNPQALNRYSYTLNNPLRYIDPSGHTTEDYYVFVQGCIDYGQTPKPCGNDPKVDWHDYLSLLREQLGLSQEEFDPWMATHVKFVRAFSANPSELAQTVNGIDPGKGQIYLLGHSAGGAAVLNYLNSLRKNPSPSIPRIGGAIAVDAPIGDAGFSQLVGSYVGFKRTSVDKVVPAWGACYDVFPCGYVALAHDNFQGLGNWANQKGIQVLTVSYQDDWINPLTPTADVPFKMFPGQPGFAGPFDIGKNHGYFFQDPNGLHSLFSYLIEAQALR